jgi:hypothetical protein
MILFTKTFIGNFQFTNFWNIILKFATFASYIIVINVFVDKFD